MCDLCVTLGGLPLYCMCDCFYLHGQDRVGAAAGTLAPIVKLLWTTWGKEEPMAKGAARKGTLSVSQILR